MNIIFINDEPYFTPTGQINLQNAAYIPTGFTAFSYEPDLRYFKKIAADHYKNMINTFRDKVYKSLEIKCGIYCNTVWKKTIANFMDWDVTDTVVYINALQSSNDAVVFNTKTSEYKSLER
jgi:hypothetical protein